MAYVQLISVRHTQWIFIPISASQPGSQAGPPYSLKGWSVENQGGHRFQKVLLSTLVSSLRGQCGDHHLLEL